MHASMEPTQAHIVRLISHVEYVSKDSGVRHSTIFHDVSQYIDPVTTKLIQVNVILDYMLEPRSRGNMFLGNSNLVILYPIGFSSDPW